MRVCHKMKKISFFVILSLLSALGIIFYSLNLAKYVKNATISDNMTDIPLNNIGRKTKIDKNEELAFEDKEQYRKHVYDNYYRPIRNPAGVNCSKILKNDRKEISKAQFMMKYGHKTKVNLTTDFYFNITESCSLFRSTRGYIQHSLSEEEREFPIAFSILVYTDIEQVERLLRLIYRPHNYYCIHTDLKMNHTEKVALRRIANCLANVFIAEESVNVTWGKFSLLEAEIVCMKTLWPFKAWKYYINLTGQEFPLKTNRHLVAILKVLNGANIVQGINKTLEKRIGMKKSPPPHGIHVIKGSMHIAVNRFFVDFCLHDKRAHDYLEWLKPTIVPDESFFSSLNYNKHLGIQGSYLGEVKKFGLKPFFLRFVIWRSKISEKYCHGIFVRRVCVFGVEDLFKAYNGQALFANKFHLDYEHIALDCLEEVLYELTWKQFIDDINIDVSFYKNLDFVEMHDKYIYTGDKTLFK